jgi:hypothetical protein
MLLFSFRKGLRNPLYYNVYLTFPSSTVIVISTSRTGWPDTSWLICRIIAAPKGVKFSLWAATRRIKEH